MRLLDTVLARSSSTARPMAKQASTCCSSTSLSGSRKSRCHIRRAFADDELSAEGNMQKVHTASSDKPVILYGFDTVISVGYRVNSARGTQFRI